VLFLERSGTYLGVVCDIGNPLMRDISGDNHGFSKALEVNCTLLGGAYRVSHHGLITELSRKAKAAKNVYEYLRQKVKSDEWIEGLEWESIQAVEGIVVPAQERPRILSIRIQDEHLSPYFKTDMNLFQMHMLDDTIDVTVYKAVQGWLFVYEGVALGPKPFGQLGFDTR
jgi:hypothetical protein